MSDKPETIAAIIAEMRNAAKDSYAEKTAKRLEDHEATGTRDALDIKDAIQCLRDDDKYLLDLADSIEAAVEREREKQNDECNEAFDNGCQFVLREMPEGNAAAMREALEWAAQFVELGVDDDLGADGQNLTTAAEMARAALSAPARNCDRFATEDEAREAYWAYREPLEFNNKPFVAITEWLFAPAEGGDHA